MLGTTQKRDFFHKIGQMLPFMATAMLRRGAFDGVFSHDQFEVLIALLRETRASIKGCSIAMPNKRLYLNSDLRDLPIKTLDR